MKKLLFAIAICGFALTSCGNKTKATTSEDACCSKDKQEVSAEVKSDSTCCTKTDSTTCTTVDSTATTKTAEAVESTDAKK